MTATHSLPTDVRLDTGMRADIVVLATGACYDRLAPGEMGTLDKHGNPNLLTLDNTSKLGQSPIAHTVLVQVERYVGQPDHGVRSFRPCTASGGCEGFKLPLP